MERLKKAAMLINLIEELEKRDSWCGETRIQKATFFLQDLMKVPLEFQFIMYKHGPFSFDLRDELTAMRSDKILEVQMKGSYPIFTPGKTSDLIKRKFPKTINQYMSEVQFIAEKLGDKMVKDLERLGTALFVTLKNGLGQDIEPRASRICELKPHLSSDEAREAIKSVDIIIKEASELLG